MNKTEKIICILLGGVLAWYLFTARNAPKQQASSPAAQGPVAQQAASASPAAAPQEQTQNAAPQQVAEPALPQTPEELFVLENDILRLELTTWGAAVKKATLKKYARDEGEIDEDNPPVEFDFSSSALGAFAGKVEAWKFEGIDGAKATFSCGEARRTLTLGDNYLVTIEDTSLPKIGGERKMSLGVMSMGDGKNDLLSVDSWTPAMDGGKVVHHCEGDSPLKSYLVGGLGGGCSGSKSAVGLPEAFNVDCPGPQTWIALKNRFFVTALVSSSWQETGFAARILRDRASSSYRPKSVSATVSLSESQGGSLTSVFYVGPKKQSILWDLGMKDVMEFGMWRWICYPILKVLNLFYALIPNYGIAIILLTILVRLLFWPLTHKSTIGMKKMQEIQPLMKEVREKFKDNPQRMQQETMALYRQHKVNPMSSCLPMLIQIPVFIALFNVLRSAVELRYAPFLWIGDLSQPEGLFSSWFPFGGLNILPILMAVTMGLQSALTPSTGDNSQQKMMVVFMPIMMLVMFYSFPSALSLYWTLSQVMSIVQMWLIRRSTAKETLMPQVIDPVVTRQMRRHS